MGKKSNRNVSQTIPNGRRIQTRDDYLESGENYQKPGYEQKGNYRGAIVVDSNKKNELVIVKLTTSKKGKRVPGNNKSKYRPYVETKDEKGDPIKLGKKFIPNSPKKDLSKSAVSKIKQEVFRKSGTAAENRKKVRKMKGREK